MKIQFLYSPLCLRAEIPYVRFLSDKLQGCEIESFDIWNIPEGEEDQLPGEMPSVVRALRRGEGFLTEGLIFCEGELLGPASKDIEELIQLIQEKGGLWDENNSN